MSLKEKNKAVSNTHVARGLCVGNSLQKGMFYLLLLNKVPITVVGRGIFMTQDLTFKLDAQTVAALLKELGMVKTRMFVSNWPAKKKC